MKTLLILLLLQFPRGSPESLDLQNHQAWLHGYTYLHTPQEVYDFVNRQVLWTVEPNPHLTLHQVSFPFARPEVVRFINNLSYGYFSDCNEPLVVTSLTRPRSRQPPNSSSRSVHPTGMAVDLRVPRTPRCKRWLENQLLYYKRQEVIEAIIEFRPPHYHVVVFPTPYLQYLAIK